MEKKPEIPPDLHDVSPDNNLDQVNKTYSKPKTTIVTIPYGVAKVVAENIDVKKVDPKFLLEENIDENPWKVNNLIQFLYYCCPECEFQDHSKENFIEHASNTHPKSIDCLKKLSSQKRTYKEIAMKLVNEGDFIETGGSKKRRKKIEISGLDVEVNLLDPNDLKPSSHHSGSENLKKSRQKKLVKSNKSISRIFFYQNPFFAISKMAKNQFLIL